MVLQLHEYLMRCLSDIHTSPHQRKRPRIMVQSLINFLEGGGGVNIARGEGECPLCPPKMHSKLVTFTVAILYGVFSFIYPVTMATVG